MSILKKFIKTIGYGLLVILIALNLFILFTGRTYLYKGVWNTYLKGRSGPSIDEYKIFSNRKIEAGSPQLSPVCTNINKVKLDDESRKYLTNIQSIAFLVYKNDSILHEEYFDGYSDTSHTNSFSMAKSIISVLVGCALKDGSIKSIDEPIGNYVEHYKNSKVTIKHVLMMASGINFDEDYINPLAYPAEGYFGSDLKKLDTKYAATEEPGKVFKYLSGNTTILAMILEKATGMKVSEYCSKVLWKPLGMEHDAYWCLDNENGLEKAFCCVISNARDFAKIGLLFMHQGNWNGRQLVDTAYVQAATNFTNTLDEDGKPNEIYGYQWWMNKYKGQKFYYMRGILGQYVICLPQENMIVVRLGKKRKKPVGNIIPEDVNVLIHAALKIDGREK